MPNRARAKLVGTALALSTLVSQPARAEGYVFDGKHTEVRFAYQIGLAKQQGRFTRVSGTLQFEAPERSQVVAVVGNRKSRDRPVARRR
jgi:polyisoprenoid-binding protein YceI